MKLTNDCSRHDSQLIGNQIRHTRYSVQFSAYAKEFASSKNKWGLSTSSERKACVDCLAGQHKEACFKSKKLSLKKKNFLDHRKMIYKERNFL